MASSSSLSLAHKGSISAATQIRSSKAAHSRVQGLQRVPGFLMGPLLGDIDIGHELLPTIIRMCCCEEFSAVDERLNRNDQCCDLRREIKIHSAPFADVYFSRCEILKDVQCLNELRLAATSKLNCRVHSPSRIRFRIQRKPHFHHFQTGMHSCDIALIGHSKQRVDFPTSQHPLDRRREDRDEHRCNRANRRPGFPVHRASLTKPPTLTHPVQHAHSLIPRLARRHSATAFQPKGSAHG